MSDERRKVWRSHLGVNVDTKNGHSTICHYGHVTQCGRYVDGGSVMWPLSNDWCDSEAEALARLAPRIAEIGARLIQQAAELLEAVQATEVVAS